jgi:hypothetical protein
MILWYWFPIKDHLKPYPTLPNSKVRLHKTLKVKIFLKNTPNFWNLRKTICKMQKTLRLPKTKVKNLSHTSERIKIEIIKESCGV